MNEKTMTIKEAEKILRKKDVHIIPLEEKRKVIAYITGCRFDLVIPLSRRDNCMVDEYSWDKLLIQDTFRVTAKCHPEDVYREDVGIEKAIIKLATKYQSAKERTCKRFCTCLEKQLNEIAR